MSAPVVSASVLERERKYSAKRVEPLPDLLVTAEVAEVRTAAERRLEATYYDTTDLRLLGVGITLRRRIGGDDAGWHLKVPQGGDSRLEYRVPLDQARDDLTIADFGRLLETPLGGALLHEVATIVTTRTPRELYSAQAALLAEVVEDEVVGCRLDPPGKPVEWREIEVEWQPDGAAVADLLEAQFARAGITRSHYRAKLAHVLGSPTIEQAHARNPVGVTLARYLRAQRKAIVLADVGYRIDVPDAVHDMRVTLRRARSALTAAAAVAGVDVGRTIRDLRWLGGELGAARDIDVQRVRILTLAESVDPRLVFGPVGDRIRSHFDGAAQQGREHALATLDAERYLALLARIDETATVLGADTHRHRHRIMNEVASTRKSLRKAVFAVADLSDGPDRDRAVHKVRRRVKRLRYLLEALEPSLSRPVQRAIRSTCELQTLLGEYQDSVVARAKLIEIQAEAGRRGEDTFTYGVLYQREVGNADRLIGRLRRLWRTVERATGLVEAR